MLSGRARTVSLTFGAVALVVALPIVAALGGDAAAAGGQGGIHQVDESGRPAVVPDDVRAIIEALLLERVAAITGPATDNSSATSTVHPDATTAVEQRRQWSVDGFRALGLSDYREELVEPALDLTPPSLLGARSASEPGESVAVGDTYEVFVVEVRRTWAIDGIDSVPASESVFLAVGVDRSSGIARTLDDDPLRSVGVTSERAMWEVAEVDVTQIDGRLFVAAPSNTARVQEVAELLRRAHARVAGAAVPSRYLVVIPSDAAEAKAFMQTPLDVSKFVAFVSFSIDRSNGWEPGPPRLVLQEGNLRRRSTERQVVILAHELVHVATVDESGPMTPLWVHEGHADWEANGRRATAATGELLIPEAHTFRAGSVSEIVAAYERSELLFGRLAQLAGEDAPRALFAAVGSVRSAPGTVEFHVDRALLELGTDRPTLEAGS